MRDERGVALSVCLLWQTQKTNEEAAKALVANIREEEEGAQRRRRHKKILGKMVAAFYHLYLQRAVKSAWKLWKVGTPPNPPHM